MKYLSISLCMIAKNEERTLPRCLESVQGQVDEIILVDTGSDDCTKEVASRYGAKVFDFAWNNDFSAARNVSLEHARGDWILWLDADEELIPSPDGVTLRQLAARPGAAAYLVPIENVKLHATSSYHWAVRFFRKRAGIRFEGKAHESVSNSLLRNGTALDRSTIGIRHWGYAVPNDQLKRKIERNLRLLEDQVCEHPDDSFAYYYMGVSLLARGEYDKSFDYLQKAYHLETPTDNLRCLILNALAYHHLNRKNYLEAEKLARSSIKITPNQHTGRLFLGLSLYYQQKYLKALPLLLAAYQFQRLPLEMRRSDLSSEEQYGEHELLWLVGRSAYEAGNHSLAHQFLGRFLREKPRDPLALALLGMCALNLGEKEAAVCHFEEAKRMGAPWSLIGAPWVYALVSMGLFQKGASILREAGEGFFKNSEANKVFSLLVEHAFEAGHTHDLKNVLWSIWEESADCPTLLMDALSVCCIKLKEFDAAIQVLLRMIQKDPLNGGIKRRLAAVYAILGRETEALRLLKNAGPVNLELSEF